MGRRSKAPDEPQDESPKDIVCEPWTARPKRGPDESGRWYWEARASIGGTRPSKVLGWRTRPDAVKAMQVHAATHAAAATSTEGTIASIIDKYTSHVDTQATLRVKLVEQGEEPRRGAPLPGVGPRTADRVERNLVILRERVGARPIEHLRPYLLDDLRGALMSDGYAQTTTKTILCTLRACWAWAHDRELVPRSPPRNRLRAAPAPKREPTREEIHEAMQVMKGWHRDYLIVLAATGMRLSEVATLEERDIDLGARMIRLRYVPGKTKTGGRSIPVPAWAYPTLEAMLTGIPERSLWPSVDPAEAFSSAARRVMEWSAKDFRDAASTAWETSGAPSWVIDGALGNTPATRRKSYGSHPDADASRWARAASPGDATTDSEDGTVDLAAERLKRAR